MCLNELMHKEEGQIESWRGQEGKQICIFPLMLVACKFYQILFLIYLLYVFVHLF